MPVSTVLVFTPSRSHLASMAIESVKPKPMLRSGAPNSTTVCMRSPMPMPDCCVARKSMSRAPDWSLAAIDQSPKRRVPRRTFSATSLPVRRLSSRNCSESVCSGSPVSPRRRFSSVIAELAEAKSVGTEETTALKSSCSPARALPVAPVPMRIESKASSNWPP